GSTVTVYDGGTPLGTTTADGGGDWSFTVPGAAALGDGTHSITATATDAAGNTSPPSAALSLVIDTQAPSSSATAPPFSNTDTFSVAYTAADNVGGSGLAEVDLYAE